MAPFVSEKIHATLLPRRFPATQLDLLIQLPCAVSEAAPDISGPLKGILEADSEPLPVSIETTPAVACRTRRDTVRRRGLPTANFPGS
jgi:hypothetical protein